MKGKNLLAVVCIFISFARWSEAGERTVNDDIVVTKYETVVVEQGKSRVFPLFHVKNQGEQTYTSVSLRYTQPELLSEAQGGQRIYLSCSGKTHHDSYWASIRLEPGKEVLLNPSDDNYLAYLTAVVGQAKGVYSTYYWFEFSDSEGHVYTTPVFEIESFAVVVGQGEQADVSMYRQLTEHPPRGGSFLQTPQQMMSYLYKLRTAATPLELLRESFEVDLLDELNKKVGKMQVTMRVLAAKKFEPGLPNFLQLMIELGDVRKLQAGWTPEPPPGKKARNVIPASELRCSIDSGLVSFAYDDSSGWLLGSVTLRALDESREPAEWVELKPVSKEQEGYSQIFGSAIRVLVSAVPVVSPIVTAGEEAKKNLDLWFAESGGERPHFDENKYDIVSTPVFPVGPDLLMLGPSVTKIVVDLPIGFDQTTDLPLRALIQVKLVGRRTWGFITPRPRDPARTEINIVRRLVMPVEVASGRAGSAE